MGLMSSKIGIEELKPGDHIYTWRSGYTYSHHGIYVGDGKVIHLTRGPGFIVSSYSRSQSSNDDPVVCCSIEDFLCDGQLYRFKYDVSGVVLLIKRAGTCSLASSNPPEKVLDRAYYLLKHGFGNYHLFGKNCEDFALYCKTGTVKGDKTGGGISGQIISLVAALSAVIAVPYQFMPTSLIGVALVVCGLYCCSRLVCDVGSESSDRDVVAVEELVHLRGAHNAITENMNTVENSAHNATTENMNTMENKTTRCALRDWRFIIDTFFAIRYWYWTPKGSSEMREAKELCVEYYMGIRILVLDSREYNSSMG
ncbi:hypothetical protein FNV43_RR25542 [Rhamnella rubrinervis]|uniref:LRAT domain-containing protein n=1 Tax=Rhamnella rubrinervis TaxID=2594499 RepID=A0A8K0GQ70_9ROSA|nr:hypothetical protein FNV43_RR25542 [Rhamnella rubrinervis]